MNAIWIVLPILTLLMFDLGLALRFEDFGSVFRHPWPIVVALVGQLVFLPAIALGLAYLLKLPPVFFIGLVLIACCPGGSSSNVFSKLAGGDVALSVTLTAISSIITLFTIPVIMGWATRLVGESVGITLPVGNLIKQNLVLMLLPVLLGIGLSSLLSRLVRNNARQRRTVVIEVGMQNAAQAISIASSPFIFANEEMAIPAILYSLMMNIVLLTYVGIVKRAEA